MEIGAVASENSNLTMGSLAPTDAIDHSFSLRPGPNLADGVQSISMSFDDMLDMINPLEHIPVLSAAYRAISGDNINPVARIGGDTLYGGILGLASAGISAVGAIANEVFAANNEGQDGAATVMASLFGNDSAQTTTQLATASTTSQALTLVASLRPSAAPTSQLPASPPTDNTVAGAQLRAKAQAQTAAASLPLPGDVPLLSPATSPSPGTQLAAQQGITLDRSKAAYGGVMDTAMLANAEQNQQLALAMANRDTNLKTQHTIANSRFAVAPQAATPAAVPAPTATPDVPVEPGTQAAMQNLIQELQAMKSVNQYKNAAQMTPIPGGVVNTVN